MIAVDGGVVPFDESLDHGTPVFNVEHGAMTATRIGYVLAANLEALYAECFPNQNSLSATYPGKDWLYVRKLDVQPFRGHFATSSLPVDPLDPGGRPAGRPVPDCTGDVLEWEKYLVRIDYSTLNGDEVDGTTSLIHERNFSGHLLLLPSNSLKWLSDSAALKQEESKGGKTIPVIEHQITIPVGPAKPALDSIIRDNIGKVNAYSFLGAAVERLLYMGTQESGGTRFDGTAYSRYIHKFHERIINDTGSSYGWNHIWRPETSTWDQPIFESSGNPIYPLCDVLPGGFAVLW